MLLTSLFVDLKNPVLSSRFVIIVVASHPSIIFQDTIHSNKPVNRNYSQALYNRKEIFATLNFDFRSASVQAGFKDVLLNKISASVWIFSVEKYFIFYF